MKRSTDRFLTTHTGSLPRPDDLVRMMYAKEEGVPVDREALAARVRAAVALFFAGTFARIASWLPLYALYAMRRTRPIVLGEFLSMPLFAALLAVYPGALTLEAAGVLWIAAYVAYGLFNLWAVGRGPQDSSL